MNEETIIPEKEGKNSEVGYKKPPKKYQFKPGQSGNPGGRPEGMSLTKVIRERLKELSPDQKRTALEWLADNIIQDALESNNKMRTLIWNYLDGMPKQSLEIGAEITEIKVTPEQYGEIIKRAGEKLNTQDTSEKQPD